LNKEAMEKTIAINNIDKGPETSSSEMPPFLSKSLRIFLSYSERNGFLADTIKKNLQLFRLSVFMAHQDLPPLVEWEEEIQKELRQCDIFVPILTEAYYQSEWTDQETGFALALGKVIIPLKVERAPKGFIGKYQALKINVIESQDPSKRIILPQFVDHFITLIMQNDDLLESMKHCLINAFVFSPFFDTTTQILHELKKITYFAPDEINTLIKGSGLNTQIYWHDGARVFLREFLIKYKKHISEISSQELSNKISQKLPWK
jgi:hypothetical protein